jgi:hypothetical protein
MIHECAHDKILGRAVDLREEVERYEGFGPPDRGAGGVRVGRREPFPLALVWRFETGKPALGCHLTGT